VVGGEQIGYNRIIGWVIGNSLHFSVYCSRPLLCGLARLAPAGANLAGGILGSRGVLERTLAFLARQLDAMASDLGPSVPVRKQLFHFSPSFFSKGSELVASLSETPTDSSATVCMNSNLARTCKVKESGKGSFCCCYCCCSLT
jgi:hypothetical protein